MISEAESRGAEETIVHTGTVIAVCYSDRLTNRVGKKVHKEGQITRWGIPGDYHYGETRTSSSTGKTTTNDRPITVVGVEAGREAAQTLGIEEIPAGGLGENLLIEGAGDLGDLLPGDQIRIVPHGATEPSAVVEVRLQNAPCSNLLIYHKQIVKELYGKRGVICIVLKEGHVQVGDKTEFVRK